MQQKTFLFVLLHDVQQATLMEPDEEWSNVYFDRSEVAQMESPRAGAACAVMPFADGEEEGSTVPRL